MYERNAIVLERYFNQMFGYNLKKNIKSNYIDYCELIDCLEKYKQISEDEENIVGEYDLIASRITEIQKNQEILNKKNNKLQQARMEVFQNIDDNSENIQRKIYDVNTNIQSVDDEIKENAKKFIDYVGKFNEKTLVRTKCEKSMRTIETEYNKRLNEMLDNYKDIDIVIEKKAKSFIDSETNEIESDLKNKMYKNGEKEKIPFSMDVIEKAIKLCVEIQKKENRIYVNIYDKSNRLFNEIKNNTIKIEKHKKTIKESKSELEFLAAMKEYLVQFLDNERLTAVNGEKDHNNLMKEACKNLEKDLNQINNLYTLLEKEISNKATKKAYTDLYNIEYLKDLEKIAEEFDTQIKKLNLPVTIINPNYWRIEGMKKIYDVFNNCVTNNYDRNIFEFIPKEEENVVAENVQDFDSDINNNYKTESNSNTDNDVLPIESEKQSAKSEIDKKIDLILGFNDSKENEENIEDDDDDDSEDDSEDEDYWFNDINTNNIDKENENIEEDEIDWSFEEDNGVNGEWNKNLGSDEEDDDWDDDVFNEDWDNQENVIDQYSDALENSGDYEEEEIDDEMNYEIDDDWEDEEEKNNFEKDTFDESKNQTNKKQRKSNKNKDNEELEEAEVKLDKKKGKHTKKGGFFSKFKK